MLFQGSEHVGTNEHFRYVQQVGGVANGSTWYDRTNYYETVPAHQLDLALWLESDRMGFFLPALTQENLDTQRGVVMNERRQRVENQPYGRPASDQRAALSRRPPLSLAGDRLHGGHRRRHPGGRAGLLPHATTRRTTRCSRWSGTSSPTTPWSGSTAWFGGIAPGPPVPPVRARGAPARRRAPARRSPDDVRLPRVYVAFRAPAYGQRAWYTADLLAAVLAGGKSSPLYRDLVYERQIAQDVGASVGPQECGGTFMLVATARPGVAAEALEEALLGHLARGRRRASRPPRPRAGAQPHADRLLTAASSGWTPWPTCSPSSPPISTTPPARWPRPTATSRSRRRSSWTTPRSGAARRSGWWSSVVPRKAS